MSKNGRNYSQDMDERSIINKITTFNFPFYIHRSRSESSMSKYYSFYYLIRMSRTNNIIRIHIIKTSLLTVLPVEAIFHSSVYDIKFIEDLIRKSRIGEEFSESIYGILTSFRFENISYRMSKYYGSLYYVFIPHIGENETSYDYRCFYASGKKENSEYFEIGYFLFILPSNITGKIREAIERNEISKIEIIYYLNEKINKKVVYEISFVSKDWSLSKDIKTYPLIITIPYDISSRFEVSYKVNDKLILGISSSPIKEKDVGTIVTYRLGNYITRQLPFIALRPGYLQEGKNSPTNVIVDPGVLTFSVSIPEGFINKLLNELFNYLNEALELIDFECKLSEDVIFNDLNVKYILDPKLIFKSLMLDSDHLAHIKVYDNNNKINVPRDLSRFTRNMIKCFDKEESMPLLLHERQVQTDGFFLCFTRVRRFEDQIYKILKNYKSFYSRNGGKKKPQVCLIAAYLKTLFEYISERINSSDIIININAREFINKILVKMIELGIHSLAHLIRKAIASFLNIRENDLGYFVVNYSPLYRHNMLVDGYLLRISHYSINVIFKSMISIYLRSNHSYYTVYSNIIRSNKMSELVNHIYMLIENTLGDQSFDPCYIRYIDKAGIAKSSLELAISSAKYSFDLELIERLLRDYIDLYEEETGSDKHEEILYKLYLPRPELRRLIVKTVNESNERGNPEINLEELRHYMPAILEYIVPECFDGCYGCVISRYCNVKNPLLKEWIVSKQMAKLIYYEVFKGALK